MTRITIVMFLVAGLAGCYAATPFSVRTAGDIASQDEAKQRLKALNDAEDDWRAARRAEARELEAKQ